MKLEQAIQSTRFASQKHKAGLNILYTAWWLNTIVSQELKAFGLTPEQYNVLRILKGKYPERMCVKDVGCRMIEKNSNVPRIIDRLELKKLVERTSSESDKRETVIVLNASGINILEAATVKVNKLWLGSIVLSEEDALQLNTLLENMRQKE